MFEKQWVCKRKESVVDPQAVPGYPSFLVELLQERGLETKEEMDAFLHPREETLEDPFAMQDMDAAVDRVLQAAETGEPIVVYGDYDVDGITSTTILTHFLEQFVGCNVRFYLPDRFREGYGMAEDVVRRMGEAGISLLVTVDNGVRCQKEIALATELGIDVVVTDHHLCDAFLPECCAVVDPKRPGDPTKTELAGVGVAYQLMRALAIALGLEEEIYRYLPLVALGTIADSMPVLRDNRYYIQAGLAHLEDSLWLGLSKLLDVCGVKAPVSAMSLSYSLVPKLNAAGRMGDASRAVRLLLAEEEDEAERLAQELLDENSRRQALEAQITAEALEPGHLCSGPSDVVTIAVGDGWHHGVIGIVASRLVDKFHKPAIVLAMEEGTVARGSARSVEDYPLFDALSACSDLLIKFGGHDRAAGLSLDITVIPELLVRLADYTAKLPMPSTTLPRLEIDSMLAAEDLTVENAKWLSLLEPFGEGNPQPLFCTTNLQLVRCSTVGEKGKHLKLQLAGGNGLVLDAIAFQQGSFHSVLHSTKLCSVVFRLECNEWGGRERVSLVITDLLDGEYSVDKQGIPVYNRKYTTCRCFLLGREELVCLYKICRSYGESFAFGDLEQMKTVMKQKGYGCSWYQLRSALAIFEELKLIHREKKGKYVLTPSPAKVDLEQSSLYRELNVTL